MNSNKKMSKEIYIKQLSSSDGIEVFKMLNSIEVNKNGFTNEVNGMSFDEFKKWLTIQDAWSQGNQLPENYVPQSTFWLYVDDTPIGYGKIRHRISDYLLENGGTIGYSISKEYRGKGYGTEFLRLLLEQAKIIGVDKIVLTIMKRNIPSASVAENNGGVRVEKDEDWVYYYFS